MVDPFTAVMALSHGLLPIQMGPGMEVGASAPANVIGSALGAAVSTLVVGAVLVTLVPDYAERMMVAVVDEPLAGFLWGLFILLAVGVMVVALFVTVVGIVVALPLLLVAWLAWAVGSAVAFLAVADRLVGHEDGWLKPLAVAAAANGLLAVTGIGGLVSFVVGAAGFGTIVRDYLA